MKQLIKGTREFDEFQKTFERTVKQIVYVSSDVSRISKNVNVKGVFYNNGDVNKLFIMYMGGYNYAINELSS